MNKSIILTVTIGLISGSVSLAQDGSPRARKNIPIVSSPAPTLSHAKRTSAHVDDSKFGGKAMVLPEVEKGSRYEKVDSKDREHTNYDQGMKPRSKSDKMRMAKKKESK